MKVGYIRVSSTDQNESRQLDKTELDKVYSEKVSGATRDRTQLKLCIEYLREGDTLFIHSIDRLARNLKDLLNIVSELTDKGVIVKFVSENMEFGNNENPMSGFMLSMLGGFAEFERKMIRIRQAEGIRKAKERGQQLGRAPLKKKLIKEIIKRKESGQSVTDISHAMNIGTSTVYKYLPSDLKKKTGKKGKRK